MPKKKVSKPRTKISHREFKGEVCEMVKGKLVCKKQKMKVFEVKR